MFSSLHFLAHQPCRFPSTAWAGKGRRNARLFGISMFSWLRGQKAAQHIFNLPTRLKRLNFAASKQDYEY
jgi:hypothetical protein